jgi:hypothetical protein
VSPYTIVAGNPWTPTVPRATSIAVEEGRCVLSDVDTTRELVPAAAPTTASLFALVPWTIV